MKRLMLMTPVALSLIALPALADPRGHDRFDRHRGRGPVVSRGPSVGFGFGVGVGPAYPVYPAAPVYPVYPSDPYPSAAYPAPGYPNTGYPDPYYDPNDPYGATYDPASYPGNGAYSVYAPMAPPPLRREVCPPSPGPGFVWTSGFWRWGGNAYAWSPGLWVRRPAAYSTWVSGGWFQTGNRYGWRRGYWRR